MNVLAEVLENKNSDALSLAIPYYRRRGTTNLRRSLRCVTFRAFGPGGGIGRHKGLKSQPDLGEAIRRRGAGFHFLRDRLIPSREFCDSSCDSIAGGQAAQHRHESLSMVATGGHKWAIAHCGRHRSRIADVD